ncbi:hypothetical protein LOTGIDRAFT_157233 [Lottia gigantea]|uniref:Uncharacterized protein n=1 Tax=Lottia gigantea TaxID=225164 RepID=V4AX11_LOTGI|nr:hypothetical protein LOTGIDRAFT_157233 [Lottia gigantea]ESP02083.1 hypothetical protein LOTGIDRAFT_157233 [Lottia gigantea]
MIERKINSIKKSDEWKQYSQLDLDNLQEAESCILKIEQKRWFSEELKVLDNQQRLKMKSSRIKRLDPVLVSGLIRVGGRLHRSSLEDKVKHPSICEQQQLYSKKLDVNKVIKSTEFVFTELLNV